MYLLILEDGEVLKTHELLEEDKVSSDAGILEIICISGDHPRQYFDGKFHEIELAQGIESEAN